MANSSENYISKFVNGAANLRGIIALMPNSSTMIGPRTVRPAKIEFRVSPRGFGS